MPSFILTVDQVPDSHFGNLFLQQRVLPAIAQASPFTTANSRCTTSSIFCGKQIYRGGNCDLWDPWLFYRSKTATLTADRFTSSWLKASCIVILGA